MNIPIKTNQLTIELNSCLINQKYDFFIIETSEKHFIRGADILDAPLMCNNVQSVFFDSGKKFYVMMLKNADNKLRLTDVLLNVEGGENITISIIDANSISQRTMVSLLLNALGSFENEMLRSNNITGHFYCFNPKWIRRNTRNNESRILKIPCIEFSITNDMRLTLFVRTFTSELLKNQILFSRRKFEQYPKYILESNNTLRRKLKDDTATCFIMRQTKNDKTEIPFMEIQNLDRFDSSKMGIVANVISRFNKKYSGMCELQFEAINDYTTAICSKTLIKENSLAVQTALQDCKIKIIDYIGDDYSKTFCEEIQEKLKENYSIKATIGKRVSKDSLNFCILHNATYYDENNDPYKKVYADVAVQHITLEDFMGNANAAITTIIHEILIKQDIIERYFSLFDWNETSFKSDIAFGMRARINDVERYFFMTIKPDGTFIFEEKKLDLFNMDDYTDCINIFLDNSDVVGIVKYSNGDINIIRDTSWFTIPEIETIRSELSTGNTYLRGKEKRKELFSSIVDIKLFEKDDCKYYFSGIIGEGMRSNINTAANIRKIEGYKNSKVRFDDMLQLMSVTFVRNGQLTVLPFPFKYLREYIRSYDQ